MNNTKTVQSTGCVLYTFGLISRNEYVIGFTRQCHFNINNGLTGQQRYPLKRYT